MTFFLCSVFLLFVFVGGVLDVFGSFGKKNEIEESCLTPLIPCRSVAGLAVLELRIYFSLPGQVAPYTQVFWGL